MHGKWPFSGGDFFQPWDLSTTPGQRHGILNFGGDFGHFQPFKKFFEKISTRKMAFFHAWDFSGWKMAFFRVEFFSKQKLEI